MRKERCGAIMKDGRVCHICHTCSHYGGELESGHKFEEPGKGFNPKTGCDDFIKKEE